MPISEKKFHDELVEITYKFRKSRYDRRFLIVIFSGFRPRGSKYDLDGKGMGTVHANILWIKDEYRDNHTYYIRSSSGYEFSRAINALINTTLLELGLDYEHCLLAGFSKGASGALYQCLKYNFPNLLITVPRMNIASSNARDRPELLKSLLNTVDDASIQELDSLLPGLLESDRNLSKNIYLITSEADPQYRHEIAPFIDLYEKYENFNIIRSASPLVRGHTDVTRYNLSTIYGIMMLFTDSIVPVIGRIYNGFDYFKSSKKQPTLNALNSNESPNGAISGISIKEGALDVAGHVVVRGIALEISDATRTRLVLRSESASKRIALDHHKNYVLNELYFENEYFDYSNGAFKTRKGGSSDLSDLPYGRYRIGIEATLGDTTWEIKELDAPQNYQRFVSGDTIYQIIPTGSSAALIKRPLSGKDRADIHSSLEKSWSDDKVVHIEGYFVVPGVPAKNYSEVGYYLLVRSVSSSEIISVANLAIGNRPRAGSFINDPFMDYSKAYYTTRGYSGISLEHIPVGTYSLSVSCVIAGSVFTKLIDSQLIVNNRFLHFQDLEVSQHRHRLYRNIKRRCTRSTGWLRVITGKIGSMRDR